MTLTSPRHGRAEGISVLPGLRRGAPPAGPAALAGVPGRVVLGYAAVLGWLLAPLGWRRGLILAPFFVSELLLGNVYLLFAASLG